jgi:hypothetical protein
MIVMGIFRIRNAAMILAHAALPSVTKTVIRPIEVSVLDVLQ